MHTFSLNSQCSQFFPVGIPPPPPVTSQQQRFRSFPQVFNTRLLHAEDQLPPGFPTIDMGPQLKVVERTRTATMLCAASGNPDPDISWFKDFLPVNTTTNNGRIKQLRSGRPPPTQACLRTGASLDLSSSSSSSSHELTFHLASFIL